VLKTLTTAKHALKPKHKHYDCLKANEFWTYVGRKKNQKWLVYACHIETGEIVAYAWEKRDLKTARRLRHWLEEHGVSYGRIAHDNWDSFVSAFAGVATSCGKRYTQRIEGNNCHLRHRIRRAHQAGRCGAKPRRGDSASPAQRGWSCGVRPSVCGFPRFCSKNTASPHHSSSRASAPFQTPRISSTETSTAFAPLQ